MSHSGSVGVVNAGAALTGIGSALASSRVAGTTLEEGISKTATKPVRKTVRAAFGTRASHIWNVCVLECRTSSGYTEGEDICFIYLRNRL